LLSEPQPYKLLNVTAKNANFFIICPVTAYLKNNHARSKKWGD
jgi:hypothetical protein